LNCKCVFKRIEENLPFRITTERILIMLLGLWMYFFGAVVLHFKKIGSNVTCFHGFIQGVIFLDCFIFENEAVRLEMRI